MQKYISNLKVFNFIIFITLSLISHRYVFGLSIDHPYFIPNFKDSILTIGAGNGHREIEYENAGSKIDDQIYKFNESHLNYVVSPWDFLALGLRLSYDFDREYELKFGESSSRFGEDPVQSSSSGLLDPELFFIYEFIPFKDSWSQQLVIGGNPFDIKEKPGKNYRGGNDVFVEYRFSKRREDGYMYGKLFSNYYGKKRTFLPGDTRATKVESFTEVGLQLGYLFKSYEKVSFLLEGVFALSSDYNIETPELTRTADKGFIIGGKIGVNYFLSSKTYVQVTFDKSSYIYNATNEDLDQDIDYEFENYTLNFNFSYLFGELIE